MLINSPEEMVIKMLLHSVILIYVCLYSFAFRIVKAIVPLAAFVGKYRMVSLVLFVSGAVMVGSLFPQDVTPTAAERVKWRRELLEKEARS